MKSAEREAAVLELLGQVGLEREPKSLDELYSGVLLHEFLGRMLTEDMQVVLNFKSLASDDELTYQEQKLVNLTQLFKAVRGLAEEHKLTTRHINLKRIAYEDDEDELFELIRFIVECLVHEKIIIEHIKQCSPETQMFFMTVLQQHDKSDHKHSETEQLLTTIEELELSLHEKDTAIKNLNMRASALQEENDQLKKQAGSYKNELDQLKKKLGEFEELEHVFDKKDSELRQLNDQVQELRLALQKEKISSKNLAEEFDAKLGRANQQLAKYQNEHELEKLRKQLKDSQTNLSELTAKMNQDKATAKNLKEYCLKLEETQKELQNEKMEMVLAASEKDERIRSLSSKVEEFRKEIEEKDQHFTRSMKDSNKETLGVELNYQFKAIAETSVDYCTNVECQRAKEDSKAYYKRNLELTEKLQRLTAMPGGELTSRGNVDDLGAKLNSLTAENGKLKQKVAALTNNAGGFYEQALAKLKKKNGILKKRVQQQEDKRSREAATMAGVILDLQQFIQDNIPNSRIVELLRKLK